MRNNCGSDCQIDPCLPDCSSWTPRSGLHTTFLVSDEPLLQDSGGRRAFDTGAVRDIQEGKGRFDLVPPEAVFEYALHMENGAKKYGERNWEKGIPLHSYIDSALRHLFKGLMGMKDEDHYRAAFWNLGCFLATRSRINAGTLPESLDDLPYGR